MISLDRQSEDKGDFIKLLPIKKDLVINTLESKSSVGGENPGVGWNNAKAMYLSGPMSSQEGD